MNCFDKTCRLLKKSDYDFVFAKAKKISSSDFIVLYRETGTGHARLGLALSKKAVKKAHERNRIKRICRETFRKTRQLPSVDIVILAKFGLDKVSNALINSRLSNLWDKLSASYKN